MLSQKDAIVKAIEDTRLPDGSDAERPTIIARLFEMYRNSEWTVKKPDSMREDQALRAYCGNLLSNWKRRDERLGGTPPTPPIDPDGDDRRRKHRPADDEMKRLVAAKLLLQREGRPTDEIEAHIQRRTAELVAQREVDRRDTLADSEALLARTGGPPNP